MLRLPRQCCLSIGLRPQVHRETGGGTCDVRHRDKSREMRLLPRATVNVAQRFQALSPAWWERKGCWEGVGPCTHCWGSHGGLWHLCPALQPPWKAQRSTETQDVTSRRDTRIWAPAAPPCKHRPSPRQNLSPGCVPRTQRDAWPRVGLLPRTQQDHRDTKSWVQKVRNEGHPGDRRTGFHTHAHMHTEEWAPSLRPLRHLRP